MPTAPTTAPATYRRTMSGWHVALLMIAAASPLSSMLGNIPGGLIFGNGPGLPAAFIGAALLMAVLLVIYLALHHTLPGVSGFAGYVRAGLGPGLGTGAAYVTMVGYIAATLSYAVGVGYFGSLIAGSYGITLPWWALSAGAFVLIGLLGRRGAEVSGRAVMVLVAAEFALLITMNVLIVGASGQAAFPLESFTPTAMFSGQPGLALMTALTSFIGIEAGILYSRETKNARRAIPRAVYAALIIIAVFYIVTSWIIIGGLGPDTAVAAAVELEGDVIFGLAYQFGGMWLLVPMQILFCGSVLASAIAMHNAASRYTADLAADGLLPRGLGSLHLDRGVPARASTIIATVGLLVILGFALAQADPYIGLGSSLVGLLTIALFGVQIVVVVAAASYFVKAGKLTPGLGLACVAGGVGLVVAVSLMIMNYAVLTGSDSPLATAPLLILVVALAAGPVVAKRRQAKIRALALPDDQPLAAPLV